MMERGSKDGGVFTLQSLINRHIYPKRLVVDGDFGPKTEAAVRSFQDAAGLTADGKVRPGGATWRKLVVIPADDSDVLVHPATADLGPDFEVIVAFYEGVDLKAHKVGGLWHIGRGHSQTSGRPPIPGEGMKITWREMEKIYQEDKAAVLVGVRRLVTAAVTQRLLDAFASLYFNRQRTFSPGAINRKEPGAGLLEAVNRGDKEGIEREWLALRDAPALDGKVYKGLRIRRETELDCAMGRAYKLGG